MEAQDGIPVVRTAGLRVSRALEPRGCILRSIPGGEKLAVGVADQEGPPTIQPK